MSKRTGIILLIPLPSLIILFIYANRNPHPLPEGAEADRVLVEKSKRRMHLMKNGQVLKTYSIALGSNPEGHKGEEGDGRTPEGIYLIDSRNPHSVCHLSLHISYPNEPDRRRARERGASAGGDIMIHGLSNGAGWLGRLHLARDWTNGCIGVTNQEIEEIWRAVPNKTPIEIVP